MAGARRKSARIPHYATIAQQVEHLVEDQGVVGSIPARCTNLEDCESGLFALLGKQMAGEPARRFKSCILRQCQGTGIRLLPERV